MMKNKILLMFVLILLINPLIMSEMTLFNSVIKNTQEQTVNYHLFYTFDDSSAKGIGSSKDVPINLLYDVQALPFNLTYGVVDYCNFTITHFRNIYGTNFVAFEGIIRGELLNTTIERQSYYFTSMPFNSSILTFNMRDKDTLSGNMVCHYTDVRSLYEESVLVGRFTTYLDSYECDKCTQYSLEELSFQTQKNLNVTENQLGIYTAIQTAVGWNYQGWLIVSWIIKIGFIFVAIAIIFATGYFFYNLLVNLGNEI